MSEGKVYKVPGTWKKRAYVDAEATARSIPVGEEPRQVLGQARQADRLVQAYTKVKNTSFATRGLDQMVRGRRAQRLLQLHRPAPEEARRPDRDHLGGRRSLSTTARSPTASSRACLPLRQRAEEARRQEGRPRHHLHADDPRGGLRDARLHAHRRRSTRSCSAASRRTRWPAASTTATRPSSSPPTRACAAASTMPLKANTDEALEKRAPASMQNVLVVRRTGGKVAMDDGPRPLVPRRDARRSTPSARPRR